jgi:hypothetical protein
MQFAVCPLERELIENGTLKATLTGWIKYRDCEPTGVCERFAAQCMAMKDLQRSPTRKLGYSKPKLSRLGCAAELTASALCVQPGGWVKAGATNSGRQSQ